MDYDRNNSNTKLKLLCRSESVYVCMRVRVRVCLDVVFILNNRKVFVVEVLVGNGGRNKRKREYGENGQRERR